MTSGRHRYSIINEPSGLTYRGLLMYARKTCDCALLVVRSSEAEANLEVNKVLRRLAPFLVSSKYENKWPGTELTAGVALVLRYAFSDICCQVICSVVSRLYEWLHPYLPEDLSLLCGDVPWLTTISHERAAFLDLAPNEVSEFEFELSGLKIFAGDFMPPDSQELYRLFGGYLDDYTLSSEVTVRSALSTYVNGTPIGTRLVASSAIRKLLNDIHDDDLLRKILERFGASKILKSDRSPARLLIDVADQIERSGPK
jgi:hypothetical protein